MNTPGYEQLAAVLQAAYDQAAKGKGAERHADNKPFHEQPMQTGSDLLGTDAGLAFQAIKKVREGSTFAEFERFEREMLGAINYIAGMVIWRRRQQAIVVDPAAVDTEVSNAEAVSLLTPSFVKAIKDRGLVAYIRCGECGYPDNAAGTHYATCSKLTAPKEFVEQVEQTFDELEGVDDTEADHRMDNIARNGGTGEHYDDPWFGAPTWAKYKAQDADGRWNYYSVAPEPSDIDDEFKPHPDDSWWGKPPAECTVDGEPNPNWRDTLIQRP